MEIEYKDVTKHLKTITGNKKENWGREVLKGVYHNQDSVVATDGKRLLKADVRGGNFEETVIDLATNEKIDLPYPNVDRLLIQEQDVEYSFTIEADKVLELKKILTTIKSLGIKSVDLYNENNQWYIRTRKNDDEEASDILITYMVGTGVADDKVWILQTQFLLNAIEFIRTTRESTLVKLSDSTLKPISLDGYNYSYLICPMRDN